MRRPLRFVALAALVALTGVGAMPSAMPTVPPLRGTALAQQALTWACSKQAHDGAPPVAGSHAREPLRRNGRELGTRDRIRLARGGVLEIRRIIADRQPRAVLLRFDEAVDGIERPRWLVTTQPDCAVREVLRLRYASSGAPVSIDRFAADMQTLISSELLDAPVPAAAVWPDPGTRAAQVVRVASVDSGVNYSLPLVAARLARDASGQALGYDFRDMDSRPFDHDVRGSPFFVQRHGTRTAYLMLAEAPVATLVPYRFPRGHMARMADLVGAAQAAGVRIMNLSLGGPDPTPWRAFEAAARAASDILFVVSAGNDGRDLDEMPIYPAALGLPNLVSVTSADDDGRLARGSNWGATTVDLLVAAETAVSIGFDGHARFVAGSSYAAPRVAALAACLAAADPDADGAALRGALLALATPGAGGRVAAGYIGEDVLRGRRGACPAEHDGPTLRSREHRRIGARPDSAQQQRRRETNGWNTLQMTPELVVFESGRWSAEAALAALDEAAGLLAQCAINVDSVLLTTLAVPREQRLLDSRWSGRLLRAADVRRPAAVFVDDTLHSPAFEAEAVSVGNGKLRPDMVGSVWLTAGMSDAGVALAHELVHLLSNTGSHDSNATNLMHERTDGQATRLRDDQCDRARHVGQAFGWLDIRQ